MQLDFTFIPNIAGLIALIAGILILVAPKILNYVVAFYLIIVGLFAVFPNLIVVTQ